MAREHTPEPPMGGHGGHGASAGGHGASTRSSKKRKRVSWNDDVTEIPPLTEADYMKPRYGYIYVCVCVCVYIYPEA